MATGEIILFCRSRACEYCSKTEAIKMAFRVMRARPPWQYTLTGVGQTPEEFSTKFKRLVRLLRKYGEFEYWHAVEITPHGRLPHVHGFAFSAATPKQFRTAATNAGLGRVVLEKVPRDRADLAQHFAYAMKSLDSPAIKDEFLRWNAYGSKIGFKSNSHGFFPADEDGPDDKKDASSSIYDGDSIPADDHADDDSSDLATSPHTSPQEPLELDPPTSYAVVGKQGRRTTHSEAFSSKNIEQIQAAQSTARSLAQ